MKIRFCRAAEGRDVGEDAQVSGQSVRLVYSVRANPRANGDIRTTTGAAPANPHNPKSQTLRVTAGCGTKCVFAGKQAAKEKLSGTALPVREIPRRFDQNLSSDVRRGDTARMPQLLTRESLTHGPVVRARSFRGHLVSHVMWARRFSFWG
ncbi:MAG: hypothetical protein ACKVHE_37110, partial [Planctomycetales bacterium]